MKLIGILLIVFGVVALAVGGFSYTEREKVLDIGPLQATTETRKTIPIAPIAGIARHRRRHRARRHGLEEARLNRACFKLIGFRLAGPWGACLCFLSRPFHGLRIESRCKGN